MAVVTTVFDGTLASGARSSWVAVPASTLYTITITEGMGVEFSVDGVVGYPLPNGTTGSPFRYVSGTNPDRVSAAILSGHLVQYMRAVNTSGVSVTSTIKALTI